MTEERFEEMLREAARQYNDPPPTPRDEIWRRIESARQPGRKRVRPLQPRPLQRMPWWLGIAAALLVGIGIGRGLVGPSNDAVTSGTVAQGTEQVASAEPGTDAQVQPKPPEGAAADPTTSAVAVRSPELAASRNAGTSARAGNGGETVPGDTEADADVAGLYRFVAYETLGQAEALLTVFRNEARPEERARVSAWARDVLTSTRLLLDSPGAEDPLLAGLLQDLELVLAQIAALDDGRGSERELIDETIRQRDVLPRLRTVTPTGASSAGA